MSDLWDTLHDTREARRVVTSSVITRQVARRMAGRARQVDGVWVKEVEPGVWGSSGSEGGEFIVSPVADASSSREGAARAHRFYHGSRRTASQYAVGDRIEITNWNGAVGGAVVNEVDRNDVSGYEMLWVTYDSGLEGFVYPHRDNVRKVSSDHTATSREAVRGVYDEHAATELKLFAENDSQLYHQRYLPVVRNLQQHRERGNYDHEQAVKGMRHFVDAAAKKYDRQYGSGNWADVFSVPTREAVARWLVEELEVEWGLGNFLSSRQATRHEAWQDGRPNWDTGEVRLWIENDYGAYQALRHVRDARGLRESFEGVPGPQVDWSEVDWEWIWDAVSDEYHGHLASRRTALIPGGEHQCAVCGRPATYFAFQTEARASGFFACEDHIDRFREGRTVEKIARHQGARRTAATITPDMQADIDEAARALGDAGYDLLLADWYDAWGTAMAWLFAINDRIMELGGQTNPTYRPGLGGADTDAYEYQMIADVDVSSLESAERILSRLTDKLEAAGASY